MSKKFVSVRQKQRTCSAETWSSSNPLLLLGEIGVESDSNKLKIGNGIDNWNDLDYVSGELENQIATLEEQINSFSVPTKLSDLEDDSSHRLVTDVEKETWDSKQSALIFDTTPKSGSTNPVTSEGIYSYVLQMSNLLATAMTDFAEMTTDALTLSIFGFTITNTQNLSSSGVTWSGDIKIRFGNISPGTTLAAGGKGYYTVSGLDFTTTDYIVVVTASYGTETTATTGHEINTYSKTTTSFNIYAYNRNSSTTIPSTCTYNWIAIGI